MAGPLYIGDSNYISNPERKYNPKTENPEPAYLKKKYYCQITNIESNKTGNKNRKFEHSMTDEPLKC